MSIFFISKPFILRENIFFEVLQYISFFVNKNELFYFNEKIIV